MTRDAAASGDPCGPGFDSDPAAFGNLSRVTSRDYYPGRSISESPGPGPPTRDQPRPDAQALRCYISKPSRSNIVYKLVQYMPILERLPNIYNMTVPGGNMCNIFTQYLSYCLHNSIAQKYHQVVQQHCT